MTHHTPMTLERLEDRRLLSVEPAIFEVNIDPQVRHQEVVGFGSSIIDWNSPQGYERASFYNDIAVDLGANIVRVPVPQNFEARPGVFDTTRLAASMEYVQALQDRSDQTVLASVWSPPWWMKTSHDTRGGGGYLRPEMRGDFAHFLAEYVIAAKRDYGVDVDVVSIQNEPVLTEPYPNALYSPQTLAETFVVVHDHFQSRGLNTKLMVAEDLNFGRRFEEWTNALEKAYSDRGRPLPEELVWGTHWGIAYSGKVWDDVARRTQRQVWSTESGGKGERNLRGGLNFLDETVEYLERGGLSAHIIWQSEGDGGSSWFYKSGTNAQGQDIISKSGLYAAQKHVSRWIRPGSNVLKTDLRNGRAGDNGYARAVGFVDNTNNAYGTVLSNRSANDRQVVVTFRDRNVGPAAASNWKAYLTKQTDGMNANNWVRRADAGGTGELPLAVSNNGRRLTFTMPANSMITLSNVVGDPVASSAQPATTARRSQYAGIGDGMQNLSYGHEVLAVGWDAGMVEHMTNQRANLVWDANNRGLLHFAATVMRGNVPETLQHVYAQAQRLGHSFNVQDKDGMTPLMVAAATQMSGLHYAHAGVFHMVPGSHAADRVQQYVQRGADLHTKDDLGRTALHWAAITPRLSITEVVTHESFNVPRLLQLGADVNKVDASGRTPLQWARAEQNPAHEAALAAWTRDTAAPELLSAEVVADRRATVRLTFDEAVRTPRASDFVLVREDGLMANAAVTSVRTLPGGNTRVEVSAADTLRLPAGHWRIYPRDGGVRDLAGNVFTQPPETRGRNAVGFAAFTHNPADANDDGRVTFADFAILRQRMNTNDPVADFNGDGWVNLLDLAILRRDFGTNLSAGPTGNFGGTPWATPEAMPVAQTVMFVGPVRSAPPGTFAATPLVTVAEEDEPQRLIA